MDNIASFGYLMPKNATEEEMQVYSLLVDFACVRLKHAGCRDFAQQQLFSWLDSSSGEIPIQPRIRLTLLERTLSTIQNRNEEVRKFILDQSEAFNKTNQSNPHLLDMFDKLKGVLKKNPPTNESMIVTNREGSQISSDTDFF